MSFTQLEIELRHDIRELREENAALKAIISNRDTTMEKMERIYDDATARIEKLERVAQALKEADELSNGRYTGGFLGVPIREALAALDEKEDAS